uniref:NADH-ubiquinone oxidoreductase chain 3 n=1 Tax=Nemania diffusa TaxID=389665 RepID=A0A6M8NSQ2_9PEZI|nr:NADH dehydrogenase subunit 3 [Nemania diffusa]QKG05012.1 NADH dehydrogenase subunit 3 [Nemania diffusa]
MSRMTLFFLFVSIIALVFLTGNFLLALNIPNREKGSNFECGFHSFLGQNREEFNVLFFTYLILYILFDGEVILVLPYMASANENGLYGLSIACIFILIIALGFCFELGKSALKIDSRQVTTPLNVKSSNVTELISIFLVENLNVQSIYPQGVDEKVINFLKSASIPEGGGAAASQQHQEQEHNQKSFFYDFISKVCLVNLDLIFSFTDISKFYFINKDFFVKFSSIILYVLATLLGISLFLVMFKLNEGVDLFLYFNLFTIVASLVMVSLTYKNKDLLIKLSLNSLYVITNMLLLSLILSIFIYIIIILLQVLVPFNINTLSFMDCFNLSRTILGIVLSLKLTVHTFKLIYVNRKNPKSLIKNLILLILSLLILSFFFQMSAFIVNVFNVYIFSFCFLPDKGDLDQDQVQVQVQDLPELNSDKENLNNPSVREPSIDKSLKGEFYISDNSLNHHLKKYYPVIIRGKGSYLYTEDGKEIFDAASGAGAACIGYGNEKVIDAMMKKYTEGTHYLSTSYWKDKDVTKLNAFLVDSTGNQLTKVYLTGSGSDATEAALKLARQYFYDQDHETKRHMIITRENSYHGNTIGALSASSFIVRQQPFYPLLTDNVEHISSCYPYRQLIDGESDAAFVARKAQELENTINKIGADKVMCFLMEPVSGAALGCATPVPGYLKAMKDVCHKHNILLIFDEVMCGMGRTGTLHAWQEEGVAPDILIIGKGLGGGYHPISAVLASPKVCEALKTEQFIHGLTFDAVPVGAVAAWNVHQIIAEDRLIDNVYKLGIYLGDSLKAALGDHPNVGEIRGKGFFWAVEFVKDKNTKEPFHTDDKVGQRIVNLALSKFNMTIYLGTGGADGLNGDHIMIHPPYNITAEDLDHIVKVVAAAVKIVFKEIHE